MQPPLFAGLPRPRATPVEELQDSQSTQHASIARTPIYLPLQGEEAIRPCPFGQEGFVRHKCEQTNNVTRGFWSNVVDRQGCVQVNISMERDIVRIIKVSS